MSARESILPVFVPHLGCPHNCVFCNQNRISGALAPACPEDVRKAVEEADRLGIPEGSRQLAFYGGSFTAIPEAQQQALLDAAAEAKRNGKIRSIRLSTRPDAISGEILRRLRNSGVETIELGAQSMCDDVLQRSGRGHTAEDVRNASEAIKQAGFRLILQMMTGLPGDSEERDLYTAGEIIRLRPDGVRVYPTVIVKDTPLFELWKRGKYTEHTVEDAVRVCAQILPMFEANNIPVIRLGLNPTEELSGGAAAGGAYHPALGELVKSRILLQRARELFDREAVSGKKLVLGVHKSRVSQMTGQHRANLKLLCEEYELQELKVVPAELNYEEIRILRAE